MITLLLLWACTADKVPLDTGDPPDGGAPDGGADGGGTDTGATSPGPVDADGDGWSTAQDCDDSDTSVHPDADERCNGDDDDCDGLVDDADPDVVDPATFHADLDGDGYGDPLAPAVACEAPADHVVDATDCLDSDATVHPDADEVCDDGIDNNCDGSPNDCQREGTWDLSELASTVWRADDEGCLAALEREGLLGCGIPAAHMLSGSLGGQDLDGDGRPDLLVYSSWRDTFLVVPLDAASGTLEDAASARLSYAEITVGSEDCDGTVTSCRAFTNSRAVGDWDGDGYQDLAAASVTEYYDPVELGMFGPVVASSLGPFSGEVDVSTDASLVIGNANDQLGGSALFLESGLTVVPSSDDLTDDLVVGGKVCSLGRLSNNGCVYLFEDPMRATTDPDRDADTAWYSSEDWSVGDWVQDLGDTDGDGVAEILIGARNRGDEGPEYRGWVVSSEDRGWTRVDDSSLGTVDGLEGNRLISFPTRRDITGDGLLDLVVALPMANLSGVDYSGSAYILPGPFRGELSVSDDAWARFDGQLPYCYYGMNADVGGSLGSDATTLSIGGMGRDSDLAKVCADAGRVTTWYDPQPGTWSEYDADLRIDLRIGFEDAPYGRTDPTWMSHAWLDGKMVMVVGTDIAEDNFPETNSPGFIALVPLSGL